MHIKVWAASIADVSTTRCWRGWDGWDEDFCDPCFGLAFGEPNNDFFELRLDVGTRIKGKPMQKGSNIK